MSKPLAVLVCQGLTHAAHGRHLLPDLMVLAATRTLTPLPL
jgi:hypothetical protein